MVFAKDQTEYEPLPAHKTADGEVISCWSLTWRERLELLCTGKLWLSVLTFHFPLQPQYPSAYYPFQKPATKPVPSMETIPPAPRASETTEDT